MTRISEVSKLIVGLLMVVALVAVAGCGSSTGSETAASNEPAASAGDEVQPAQDPDSEEDLRALEQEVAKNGTEGGADGGGDSKDSADSDDAPVSSTGAQCGGGLSTGPDTSCPFAHNVRAAYQASGDASSISAYSPITGETYVMSCGPGADVEVVCTGGNNASVYF